jgi:hypothetical protein
MNRKNAFEIIQSLKEKGPSLLEISFLFKFCSEIAYRFLFNKYEKIKDQISFAGLTIEDVAVDSITDLFIRNKYNNNYEIRNSLLRWELPVENEIHAFFFLNKVVTQKVDQYIIGLIKQSDPLFEKIFKSVNYFIAKKGYAKIQYVGTNYIVKGNNSVINKKVISLNEFQKLSEDLISESIEVSIYNLFNYIEIETNFFPAIPLNEFVRLLKKRYCNERNKLDIINNNLPEDNLIIEEMLGEGLRKAIDKINNYYLHKNILTNTEVGTIKSALKDMVIDLRDGGINRGLFLYLEPYIPGLTKELFNKKYQSILDYLLWIMKESIAEELRF